MLFRSNQSFFNKPNDAQISATQRRDVRVVPVVKSRQVDITTCGGNTRGVFIANIGQITYYQKKIQLKEGDKIIAVNNFPLVDVTREDAQKIINDAIGNKSKSRNLVWFSVINDMYDYQIVELNISFEGPHSNQMSIYSTRLGETIGEVKLMIERYDGIPVGMQHLRYRGMPLRNDARTLRSYNITVIT